MNREHELPGLDQPLQRALYEVRPPEYKNENAATLPRRLFTLRSEVNFAAPVICSTISETEGVNHDQITCGGASDDVDILEELSASLPKSIKSALSSIYMELFPHLVFAFIEYLQPLRMLSAKSLEVL